MATAARSTFPRSHRLSGQRAFDEVFNARVRSSRAFLTLYTRPNGRNHNRLGLSVSRKLGVAVTRNRFKRLMREAYRLTRHELPTGYDLVIVPRPHDPRGLAEYQSLLATLLANCDATWKKKLNL
jgi:ribonuclease P protein component